jgi:HlyD family secretion protein
MKRKRVALIVMAVVVVFLVAGGIVLAVSPDARRQVSEQLSAGDGEDGDLMASGFIEAEEIAVAPELGGRVIELLVEEGDEVEAEQLLARLDGALLEAQIEAAQAALDVARVGLAQARAGARPEQIRQAEADLVRAEAAYDGAYQVWQDLIAVRDNPQELNAQIALAQAKVAAAEAGLAQATKLKDAAEIAYENYWDAKDAMAAAEEKIKDIPEPLRPELPGVQLDFHLIPSAYWKSWVGVNTAQAGLDGARAALNDLYAMKNDPQELSAQVDAAEAQVRSAEAVVHMAQARLDGLRAGATAEEISAAEAQVEQARAALDKLRVLQDKLTIVAPVGGLVLERSIHRGELAASGATLLTLGDLDEVTLTVYVPEDRLGYVQIGQEVEVRVDSFPERPFLGTVVAIAQEAEFTPSNVQTQEERVNMVFAVDVEIANPDHALKPGLPADAAIIAEEQ